MVSRSLIRNPFATSDPSWQLRSIQIPVVIYGDVHSSALESCSFNISVRFLNDQNPVENTRRYNSSTVFIVSVTGTFLVEVAIK